MSDPLAGRRIVLGVSGSIAAYKALTLAGHLTAAGAAVDVILTKSATQLVTPLAFQALTHRPVVTSLWEPVGPMGLDHIAVARSADLLVVAPATAHLIARLALGLADDALTTTTLATRAPLVVAPAMEPNMWSHPATQAHLATLLERGAEVVPPTAGRMASGVSGVGRMAEPDTILEHLRIVLGRGGDLAGRSVLVSAGPTREPLDPVRFLSNRSSGRMGYALARAARDRGAAVVLVSGPVTLEPPLGTEIVNIETAAQMHAAVLARAPAADAVIMTAAVADFSPADVSDRKIKKAGAAATLALDRNPDILADLDALLADAERRPVRVGFAAETDELVANARGKLIGKGLDLIVANLVPASFGGTSVEATLLDASGTTALGRRTKEAAADAVIDRVVALLEARDGPAPPPPPPPRSVRHPRFQTGQGKEPAGE